MLIKNLPSRSILLALALASMSCGSFAQPGVRGERESQGMQKQFERSKESAMEIEGKQRLTPGATAAISDPWDRDKLVAWCIVPFDSKNRTPEERAAMLEKLNIRHLAYDWRAVHIPTFDEEVAAAARHKVSIVAWWFPTRLDDNAHTILDVIKRNHFHPQLWVSGGGEPVKDEAEQAARIEQEFARLRPIILAAKPLGCPVYLYNHGGWYGRPENQLALLERLHAEGHDDVRMVYNFHHARADIPRFAELWPKMQKHVAVVNLYVMTGDASKPRKTIQYLGDGDREVEMMRIIDRSGWRGMVGILNHLSTVDAEVGLTKNRDGFDRLVKVLRSERAGPAND